MNCISVLPSFKTESQIRNKPIHSLSWGGGHVFCFNVSEDRSSKKKSAVATGCVGCVNVLGPPSSDISHHFFPGSEVLARDRTSLSNGHFYV